MASPQHYVFYGYPVEVKARGDGWDVLVRTPDGNVFADLHVSEKPIRQQLEEFVARLFPGVKRGGGVEQRGGVQVMTAPAMAPQEVEEFRRQLESPGLDLDMLPERPRPNPAPASLADLTRRLKF